MNKTFTIFKFDDFLGDYSVYVVEFFDYSGSTHTYYFTDIELCKKFINEYVLDENLRK